MRTSTKRTTLVTLVVIFLSLPGFPLFGASYTKYLVHVEYASCNGTQQGSGVAANTNYEPTTTYRGADGSTWPAVEITSTTSKTRTGYLLTWEKPYEVGDTISFQYSTGGGFIEVGGNPHDAIAIGCYNLTFTGISYGPTDDGRVYVAWSNAGRITGSTYGTGSGNWVAATNLNWKWRAKKVSYIEYEPGDAGAYQIPVYVNDWTGEYTTDFETYYNGSQIKLFGEDGPSVFMTKQNFILVSSVFGAFLAAVILFALFKAVL